jgi:CRISP-associated protein Cas1
VFFIHDIFTAIFYGIFCDGKKNEGLSEMMRNCAGEKLALSETGPRKRLRLAELSEQAVQNIVALRQAGNSFRNIAANLGLSHGSVQRLLKQQATGMKPLPSPPRIPRRPRNGQAALPDFEKLAKLTAKGKTVKEVWRAYAQATPKAYCYTHFSTLFRVWLNDNKLAAPSVREPKTNGAVRLPASQIRIPDYTADEDAIAEGYWKDRIDPRAYVQALYGNACALKVDKGELVSLNDGQVRRFAKVIHGLKAIVFLGQSGNLTLDAIKWCEAQGIAIALLDWYGELLSLTQPALKTDVAIRRAQFAADRLAMAKAILTQKTRSQARIRKIAHATYRKGLDEIKKARSVDELVKIEGRIALEYWSNWSFELRHKKRNWPVQWTRFIYRASSISGGPRHAMHPVNAILNYAYSVVAAQVTRALQASGFDSAAGYLHADAEGRHSLTYDVMELLRAEIDNAILPWVVSHTWKRPDFPVTPEGIVRLQPTLAAVVAQRAMVAQGEIDTVVGWLRAQSLRPRSYDCATNVPPSA